VSGLLRRAQEADAAELGRVEREVFPHPWTSAQLAAELRQPSALGLVVEEAADGDAAIVGFALFRRLLDEAELLRLAVLPPWRRRGLGGELASHGLGLLREAGVRSVFLEVRADNEAAIRFYEQSAWRLAGRRARYYPDGADALLYRREP